MTGHSKECPYTPVTFCNKCGWVPDMMGPDTRDAEIAVLCKENAALATQLEEIGAEAAALRAVSESRYDCHGGPGTCEPACNACVTCLMRVIDALGTQLEEATLRDFNLHDGGQE